MLLAWVRGLSISSARAQLACSPGRPAHEKFFLLCKSGHLPMFHFYYLQKGNDQDDAVHTFDTFTIATSEALLRSNKVRQRLQDLRSALPSAVPQGLGPPVLEKIAATWFCHLCRDFR